MIAVTKKLLQKTNIMIGKCEIAGAKVLNKIGLFNAYQVIPDLNFNFRKNETHISQIKWQAIKNCLPNNGEKLSVLEIGCNLGLYSISIAKLGHFVTAIDGLWYYSEFCYQAAKILGLSNIAVGNLKITPENVHILPEYDCILFMNIFHHICVEYGEEVALEMLDAIYNKAKRLMFFETEQSDSPSPQYKHVLPYMGDKPIIWIKELFLGKGAAKVEEISYNNNRWLTAIYK